MRHYFTIPIGDWSSDGHGRCHYYPCSATVPINEVREAYFAAKEKLPEHLWPEVICAEYEEDTAEVRILEELRDRGGHFVGDREEWYEVESGKIQLDKKFMLDLTIWFINQGNPAVAVRKEPDNDMLPFYGTDEKGRHISFIGYGVTGY